MGKTRYLSIRNRRKSKKRRTKSKKRRTKSKKRIGRGKNTLKPDYRSIINACKLTNEFIHNESFTDSESSSSPDSETKSPQRTISKNKTKTQKESVNDRVIGKGSFSHIFFCKKKYALKFSGYKTWENFNGEDTDAFKKDMEREVKVQNELAKHDLSLKVDYSGFMEEKDRELWHYSIMKKADGDIRHFINLIIKMKADINIDEIVEKITTLYDNLHKLNYTHYDIRPGNIVYILEDKKDINSVKFYLIDFNFTAESNEYIEREKKELIKDVIIPLRTRITEGRMCDLSEPFIN